MGRQRIAIIGGGFTGLVAAYDLARAGHAVTLYERGSRLGGLAGGCTIGGHPIEQAYHHLFTTHRDMLALVAELGLTEELVYATDTKAILHAGACFPFTTPRDLLRFTALPVLDRVRFGVVTLALLRTRRWERFLRIPAKTWLRRWYGARAYDAVWGPLLTGKFHTHDGDVSMAWLWARIHERGNSRDRGSEQVIYFRNGFQSVVDALTERLTALGVEIQRNAEITRIASDASPALTFADRTTSVFDRIIATIPSHTFARLIADDAHATPAYLAQLRSVHYLGAVLLVFATPQSLSPYYWHNINDPASPFLVFLQHTNLVPKEWYGGQHVYYLGAYLPHDHPFFSMAEDDVLRAGFDDLKRLFPTFDLSHVTERHCFRFQNAQHVVDTDYITKIPSHETPLPGVFLANFSQIFPEDRGTSHAVREGRQIAGLALDGLPDDQYGSPVPQ